MARKRGASTWRRRQFLEPPCKQPDHGREARPCWVTNDISKRAGRTPRDLRRRGFPQSAEARRDLGVSWGRSPHISSCLNVCGACGQRVDLRYDTLGTRSRGTLGARSRSGSAPGTREALLDHSADDALVTCERSTMCAVTLSRRSRKAVAQPDPSAAWVLVAGHLQRHTSAVDWQRRRRSALGLGRCELRLTVLRPAGSPPLP